jgi:hypothetical protein
MVNLVSFLLFLDFQASIQHLSTDYHAAAYSNPFLSDENAARSEIPRFGSPSSNVGSVLAAEGTGPGTLSLPITVR